VSYRKAWIWQKVQETVSYTTVGLSRCAGSTAGRLMETIIVNITHLVKETPGQIAPLS